MLLKRLVIGSDIESILYAFLTDSYFLPTSSGPIFYEKMHPRILGSERKDYTWSRLQAILALTGKLLNYQQIKSVRISEDDIKISSDEGFYKYKFEECNIFDTTGISVLNNIREHKESKFVVYDDFEISQLGGKHKYLEPKETDDDLASSIHFYISDRVDGADYITDCVSKSVLTRAQINEVEYSDSMARFAVIRHLTSIGIYGNFMNLYKNGLPKYRKPKVVHKKRLVLEREQTTYENSERVKFLRLTIKEIFDEFSTTRS